MVVRHSYLRPIRGPSTLSSPFRILFKGSFKPEKGSVVQQLVQARSRIDFGLNKADEVALNFETIFQGKGNYFERMENLGKVLFMTHIDYMI